MKKIFNTIFAAAVMTLVGSCDFSDFGDINISPNNPGQEYSHLLFAHATLRIPYFVMTSATYDPWPQFYAGYLAESKNNQYGPLGTTNDFSTGAYYYVQMKECTEVIRLNTDESTKNTANVLPFGSNGNQIAAATALRAFYMMSLTDILGPLPYSECWKVSPVPSEDDLWYPKFDSQKDIYTALNKELEDTYSMFSTSGALNGTYDLVFGGDMNKWKKFNATLRMMMAIKLADVDPSTGASRFSKAYSDGGMTSASDSFCWTFDEKNLNSFMYTQASVSGNRNFVPNKVIVEALKEYQDPRMFTYFTLDGFKGKVAGDPTDFNAYIGVPFGLESNTAVLTAAKGCCSVNNKYCDVKSTYGLITAARCLLVEAEAAKLGWIDASAEELYYAGIKASFDYEEATGYDEYIKGPKVVWADSMDQIIMQRWLAGYMTDGIEAWSDWRRYNIPVLPIEKGQANRGITVYPYRMKYGDNDRQYNKDNYDAIVASDLGGNDDRWTRVWWDVKDNI